MTHREISILIEEIFYQDKQYFGSINSSSGSKAFENAFRRFQLKQKSTHIMLSYLLLFYFQTESSSERNRKLHIRSGKLKKDTQNNFLLLSICVKKKEKVI